MERRHLEYGQAKRAFLAYLDRDETANRIAHRVRARLSKEAHKKGVKMTPSYLKESEVLSQGLVDMVCDALDKKGYVIDAGKRKLLASQLLYSNLLDGESGSASLFGSSPSHLTQRHARSNKPSEHQVARVRRRERD